MAKNEDGVWRTVGGRRIFIKDGQDLASAMKESGKFKKTKKIKVEGYSHKIDEDYEERLAKYKEIQKNANKRYDNGEIDKEERNKLIDDAHDKYIKQKGLSDREEEHHNPRKEAQYYLEKGEFDKFDKAIEKYGLDDEREEFLDGTNRRIAADYKEHKMKQEYMNIPEKERVQAYVDGKDWKDFVKEKTQNKNNTYKSSQLENGKPYSIDMGNGIKKTAIYVGKDEDGNNMFYDGEGVTGTFGFSDRFVNEKIKVEDNKDDDTYMRLYNKLRKTNGKETKSSLDKSTTALNDIDRISGDNEKLRTLGKQIGASALKKWEKAFNEYKKEHPNTSLDLYKFIKINEL